LLRYGLPAVKIGPFDKCALSELSGQRCLKCDEFSVLGRSILVLQFPGPPRSESRVDQPQAVAGDLHQIPAAQLGTPDRYWNQPWSRAPCPHGAKSGALRLRDPCLPTPRRNGGGLARCTVTSRHRQRAGHEVEGGGSSDGVRRWEGRRRRSWRTANLPTRPSKLGRWYFDAS
jgi:hypothetical protein